MQFFSGVADIIKTAIFLSFCFIGLFLVIADPAIYLPSEIGLPEWMFQQPLINYLPSFILLVSASMLFVGLYIIYKEI